MKYISFLILLIKYSCMSVDCIQQGDFIAITEAPYFASLVDNDRDSSCGAAILSEYWLVSAAHCVAYNYKKLEVRTGATSSYSNGSIHNIDNVVIHDNYSYIPDAAVGWIHANDISLIKLKQPIKFDEYQQSIKLHSTPPRENDTLIVVGLGYEQVQKNPPSLKKIVQSITTTPPPFVPKPPSVFHLQNSTSHLCPGDSGNPGVIDNELAGIAVLVYERCMDWSVSHTKRYPGAFTRIDMFYNWILKHTGIEY